MSVLRELRKFWTAVEVWSEMVASLLGSNLVSKLHFKAREKHETSHCLSHQESPVTMSSKASF